LSASPSSATTAPVTLNGLDQTTSTAITLTISGANQTGWNITAWAPNPSNSNGSLTALSIPSQPTLDPCTGKNCVNPTPTGISWPITLGTTSATATKIYNAATNTGTGTITLYPTFQTTIHANTLAGTYTTNITLTITNGP
jgi:hypothetical protein